MHRPKLSFYVVLLFFFLVVGILGATYYSQFESATPVFSHKSAAALLMEQMMTVRKWGSWEIHGTTFVRLDMPFLICKNLLP